jgi:RNA polymerase sigma-70 factor (ECF subfamily)
MREAFGLREYDGMPYQEIADLLNIKLETAKVRVFRAKQKIREILEPYLNEFSRD